jgi:NADPH-dependent ferric siderophore reductase
MNYQAPIHEPVLERHRHEVVKRRTLSVKAIERITPNMLRLSLTGEDLADFSSLSPGDHIKVFVADSKGFMQMRDYTPRAFDNATRSLIIDFALHEAGPATLWALKAKVGDRLEIGGPRGSLVISNVKRWLLVGDETALPSIGRRIEEAKAGTAFTSLVSVTAPAEEQTFETKASHTAHWVHRPLAQANDPAPVLAALKGIDLAPETFVWIGTEATVARAVRAYLTEERGVPLNWLRASGYWSMGIADAHDKLD